MAQRVLAAGAAHAGRARAGGQAVQRQLLPVVQHAHQRVGLAWDGPQLERLRAGMRLRSTAERERSRLAIYR